jgi:hypothetical protein
MLSVCCLSGGPPARLAALLRGLRDVADEVVVAVDERVDPDALGAVAELADTLVRYPFAPPVERPFAWLHSLCRGDWIFRVDDDEVPGAALLDALRTPGALPGHDGALTHAYFPRRWLWRDGFLADDPWAPDWQLRLVRPAAARFPGLMHVPIHADGPHAYVEAPLYHLDLVVNDRAAREEKARRYDRERVGLRLGGRPLNEAYYLPESREPRVVPMPPEDEPLVRAVLEAPSAPGVAPALRLAARDEIDAHWAERALPESAYRARLEVGLVPAFVAGEVRQVDVCVTNLGSETWLHGPHATPEIRLSYHGLPDALRTPLPHDLPPGATALVPVSIAAPEEPGRHAISLDVVHERHRWLGAAVEVELEVRPRRRAVVLVGQPPGEDAFDRRVDDVLASLDADLEPLLVGPKPDWLRDRFGAAARAEPPSRADDVRVVPAGRRRDRLRLQLAARRLRR